jgi:hypothetical protein
MKLRLSDLYKSTKSTQQARNQTKRRYKLHKDIYTMPMPRATEQGTVQISDALLFLMQYARLLSV